MISLMACLITGMGMTDARLSVGHLRDCVTVPHVLPARWLDGAEARSHISWAQLILPKPAASRATNVSVSAPLSD